MQVFRGIKFHFYPDASEGAAPHSVIVHVPRRQIPGFLKAALDHHEAEKFFAKAAAKASALLADSKSGKPQLLSAEELFSKDLPSRTLAFGKTTLSLHSGQELARLFNLADFPHLGRNSLAIAYSTSERDEHWNQVKFGKLRDGFFSILEKHLREKH
ncbi:hypothetical protein HY993_04470 [Candidatus Micrarchaeota archaeon]|nr:hypothetical protein [Candidatus Micrarchaeota archaeon]